MRASMSCFLRLSVLALFILNVAENSFCHTYPSGYEREKGLLFDFYPAQKLTLPKGAMKKTKYVKDNMECVFACMSVHWCRSINFKIAPQSSGLHACQLISSDQFTGKQYMGPSKAYNHYSVKNPCQEAPCRNGGKCIFQENRQRYKCECKKGFEGDNCEKDIDECSTSAHSCHANAQCTNKAGSYTCQCNHGYQGDGRTCKDIDECSTRAHSCHANAQCTNKAGSYTCQCNHGYQGDGRTCKDIDECSTGANNCHANAQCTNEIGSYKCQCKLGLQGDGRKCFIQAYYSKGWTLIARFSNNDAKNWMRDDASWWYSLTTPQGDVNNPGVNQDMISAAFWMMNGNNIKITRSDDSHHTALLQTSNCFSTQTFRSMISSYGTFMYNTSWASNQCRGSCHVSYGGSYRSTHGFSQSHCSSDLQSSNYISFWCDWSTGDGAVMMIGGGGSGCKRADHGIARTEANAAAFHDGGTDECDFGDEYHDCQTNYALNLWIK